jgi:hypothetical protein
LVMSNVEASLRHFVAAGEQRRWDFEASERTRSSSPALVRPST